MNRKYFNKLVNNRLKHCKNVLTHKADVYASQADRFSNFKTAARMLECTPEKALEGFMTKHYVALHDFIDTLDTDYPMLHLDEWHEKIGDIINYLLLLEGLVTERWLQGMPDDFGLKPVRKSAPPATPNSTHQPPVIDKASYRGETITPKDKLTGTPELCTKHDHPGNPLLK